MERTALATRVLKSICYIPKPSLNKRIRYGPEGYSIVFQRALKQDSRENKNRSVSVGTIHYVYNIY